MAKGVKKDESGVFNVDVFEDFALRFGYRCRGKIGDSWVSYNLYAQDGTLVGGKSLERKADRIKWAREGYVDIGFKNVRLNPGLYTITMRSRDSKNAMVFDLYNLLLRVQDRRRKLIVPDVVASINFENRVKRSGDS